MSIPYLNKDSSHPSLPMNRRADEGGPHVNEMEAALRAILKEPYGCVFCDSGKLRNRSKPHDPACGFGMAKLLICQACDGTGQVADYVGLEMRCVGVECSDCKGTGRPLPSQDQTK